MPTLKDFGFDEKIIKDKRACYDFVGGEDQGLKRIQKYIHINKSIEHYA